MRKSELICDCDILHNDVLLKVKNNIEDDKYLYEISKFYKAMADNTRIKIIAALSIEQMCVCDICVLLNMTKSAISHQLKKLKDMNLVKCLKKGKEVFYSLKDDHVREVFEITSLHVKEKLL